MVGRFVIGVSLLVLSGLALLTCRQAMVWQNDVTLWAHAVGVTPEKPRPLLNYARALALTDRLETATAFNAHAYIAAADPRRPENRREEWQAIADLNQAMVLLALGERSAGKRHLARALGVWPDFPPAVRMVPWFSDTP